MLGFGHVQDQGTGEHIMETGARATWGGGTGARALLKFSERTKSAPFVMKSALFVMKSALFVQTNVAVNTNLTSKMPFVFPERIYVCPLTQDNYVVNSILTSQGALFVYKHITI